MKLIRRSGIAVLLTAMSVSGIAAPSAADLEKTPQAKAYRAQLKAAAAGDYEGYRKVTSSESLAMMDKQMKDMGKAPKDGLQLVTMLSLTDIHFTDLKVTGKKATLGISGKSDGQPHKGSVDLVEEGGQWKVGRGEWSPVK